MEKHDHFSDGVTAKLKHYVYRLIDPRNGSTFYVGRGQGTECSRMRRGSKRQMILRRTSN